MSFNLLTSNGQCQEIFHLRFFVELLFLISRDIPTNDFDFFEYFKSYLIISVGVNRQSREIYCSLMNLFYILNRWEVISTQTVLFLIAPLKFLANFKGSDGVSPCRGQNYWPRTCSFPHYISSNHTTWFSTISCNGPSKKKYTGSNNYSNLTLLCRSL